MPEERKLNIEQLVSEEDPVGIVQTGTDPIDITFISFPMQEAYGIPERVPMAAPTYRIALPRDYFLNNTLAALLADLESATPSIFNEVRPAVLDNQLVLQYLVDMVAQAWTWNKNVARGIFPNLSASLCSILGEWEDFVAGIMGQPCPLLQEDGTEATTVAEAVSGLNWCDDGLGVSDMHWTWIRRWFWRIGLFLGQRLPEFANTINTNTQISVDRTLTAIYMQVPIIIYWIIGHLVGQSCSAEFALALSDEKSINKKVSRDLRKELEAWCYKISFHNKTTKLYGGPNSFTGHVEMLDNDFIDIAFIDDDDIDDFLDEFDSSFDSPSLSLKLGRSYAGIGKFDNGVESNFFAVLFNFGYTDATEPGESPNHYRSQIAVGLNYMCWRRWVEGVQGYKEDLDLCVEKQKLFSHLGLRDFFKDFFSTSTFKSAYKAYIDNNAYKAIRVMCGFGTLAHPMDAADTDGRDPHDVEDGGGDVNDYFFTSNAAPYLFWLYPYLYSLIPENDALRSACTWTRDELKALMFYGCLLSVTPSTDWIINRFRYSRMRFIDVINAKTKEIITLVYNTTQELRYENIRDVCGVANTVTLKYGLGLSEKTIDPWESVSPARLLLKGSFGTRIIYVGNWGVLKELALLDLATEIGKADIVPAKPAEPITEAPKTNATSSELVKE